MTDTEFKNPEINISKILEDAIGVSIDWNNIEKRKVEKIKMWVSDYYINCLKTKVIHESQKITKCPESSGNILIINVILTFELENKILSYREYVQILEPKKLADKMKERIQKMNQLYED